MHLFCHVHMSLPCTGGSPLQNFSGGKRIPEHEKKFFELLSASEKLLNELEYPYRLNCQIPTSTGPIQSCKHSFRPELHSGLLSMLVQWN